MMALLGHKDGDITTHYSAVEIAELLEAVNRVCARTINGQGLVVIRAGMVTKIPAIPSQSKPVLLEA
jgi:hypothetical protein